MSVERVVVTGLGAVSALGSDYPSFWQALCAGKSGIAPITSVDCADMRFTIGAEAHTYEPKNHFNDKQLAWLDRFAQFALVAAKEAVVDAGLAQGELANSKTAVITGSCLGGKITEDNAYQRLYLQHNKRAHPNVIPTAMANSGASHIALTYGITGPSYTVSTACASSTHAIGQAYWLIRQGIVQRAITGGSEAPFSPGHLRSWEALRVVSADTCRPFSGDRSGMVLGEGGAMLVLESLSSALARGAEIHAELVGFGMSADASHLTDPNSLGQIQAIMAALADADLAPESIHYINAHGTGTTANDAVESCSIRQAFPQASTHLLVSSTKGAHGHLLGATGALETVATCLALKYQQVPPTIHYSHPCPDCDIPLVTNQPKAHAIQNALCFSFAFGGLNAILALKKWQ